MSSPLIDLIQAYARKRSAKLAPDWSAPAGSDYLLGDEHALASLMVALGWDAPGRISRKPKANEFPLLVYTPQSGWGMAEQWVSDNQIRVLTIDGLTDIDWSPSLNLVSVTFPVGATSSGGGKSREVIWSAVSRRKKMLLDASIATVVLNIIALATSIYSMQVYDRVIPRGGFETLWVLTGGMLFALLIDFLIRNTRSLMVDREAAEIDEEISEYFFARMQAVRLDARPPGVGTMAAQLRGIDQIRSLMASASLFVIADLPFAFLFIVVMFAIGGPVAVVPLVVFPLSLLLAFLFSRLIIQDTAQAQVSGNRKNGLLVESLDAAETVKANLGGWHMLAAWNTLNDQVHLHDLRVRRWSSIASSTFSFLQQVSYVGVVVWGAYQVSIGDLTMGGLIACSIISGRINGPLVAALPNLIVQWGYSRSSLQALDAVLELASDHSDGVQKISMSKGSSLQMEGVKFAHPGSRHAIDIASLQIEPGERIGFIGAVGSGKSTVLRLLAGLYAPQEGHVLLNGVDIGQVSEQDIRRDICYFPQDYRLINGSLRDNLVLGLSNPGDEALIEAAVKTGLSDFIKQHPKGLDLPIAEGGRGLSGGQRVLVGLTRILLMKPRILLLDEPTASLDQESEARALQAIFTSAGPETAVVLVTHKMQLVGLMRRLIVLGGGRVAHDGQTQDVIEQLRARKREVVPTQTQSDSSNHGVPS
jgi:ATP-binding cassette subfamily C protein LapB